MQGEEEVVQVEHVRSEVRSEVILFNQQFTVHYIKYIRETRKLKVREFVKVLQWEQ